MGGRKRRAGYLCPGQFQFVTPRAVAITPPSLADLRRDLSFQAVFAGFLTVFVGLAGTVTLLFQAAQAMRLSHDQTASWLLASCISVGVTGVLLSWRFRAPVVTAYALPGIVLLIHDGGQFAYAEVIGTLIVVALALLVLGYSGLFERLSSRVPGPLAAAVLAGILIPFGLRSFAALPASPVVVGSMVAVYLLGRALFTRYAVPAVLLVGLLASLLTGGMSLVALSQVGGGWLHLVFTAPALSGRALLVIGVPTLVLCLATQHLLGLAVMRASGYARVPASPLVGFTALTSVLSAPFGAHTTTLAAITAALCAGPEAHPDVGRRYVAGLSSEVFYLLAGLSGGVLAGVFAALPISLVQALAGLALIATILNSLTLAMQEPRWREAALLTVLVTASGLSVLGIGSGFWGLVVGTLSAWLLEVGARRRGEVRPESVPHLPPSLEAQPLEARPPEIQTSAQETVR